MATTETHDPAHSAGAVQDPARTVLNQAPPLEPVNLFEVDVALREALEREGGDWGVDRAREAGAVAGSAETREHSRRAERNLPILRTHDRFGNRIDQVELDPSWHWLLRGAIERDIHSLPWRESRSGGHVVRAALFMLWGNANDGVMCPVSMTYAAIPALRDGAPELAAEWEPRLTKPDYDHGALAGMAMTERQGGSDVRANITRADPVGDDVYEIHGHKWFCSYPPCDVFLVLAQAPGGLSCFLVKRGPGMEFQRLKDKLGTRSLPSSEVEFRGHPGTPDRRGGPGSPGHHPDGQPHPAGLPARCDHRSAPGHAGGDPPRPTPLRLRRAAGRPAGDAQRARRPGDRVRGHDGQRDAGARSYDEGDEEAAFRRFATAVMKYWACKRAACARGRGARVPGRQRLHRGLGDARCCTGMLRWARSGRGPATWRRSTCCGRSPRSPRACRRSWRSVSWRPEPTTGWTPTWLASASGPTAVFAGQDPQFEARRVVEELALALQGSLLVRHSPPPWRTPSARAGWRGEGGRVYGTLPPGVAAKEIIDRALPL